GGGRCPTSDTQCSGGFHPRGGFTSPTHCLAGGRGSPRGTPPPGPQIESGGTYYQASLSSYPTARRHPRGQIFLRPPPPRPRPTSPQRCAGGSNAQANCTANSECPGGSCLLTFGSECCDVTPTPTSCNGGTNDNGTCSVDSECPGGTCSGIPLICSAGTCNP